MSKTGVRKTRGTVNEGHLKHKVMNERYNRIRRSKLKESTGYRDFDSYYYAAWEDFLDTVEYVDDAIEGGRGVTYIRFNGDNSVYQIREEEAVDKLDQLFQKGANIAVAVNALKSLAKRSPKN